MDEQIEIHGRIFERHPELRPEDIAHAWGNRIASGFRQDDMAGKLVVVGFDVSGRMIEMVASLQKTGIPFVFHAMTPPSKKTLSETRLV